MATQTRVFYLTLLLILQGLLQAVMADEWDTRCEDRSFCLTSFVWCPIGTTGGYCSYPDDVYSLQKGDGPSGYAAVLWSTVYNLTGKKKGSEYPVPVSLDIGRDLDLSGSEDDPTEAKLVMSPSLGTQGC